MKRISLSGRRSGLHQKEQGQNQKSRVETVERSWRRGDGVRVAPDGLKLPEDLDVADDRKETSKVSVVFGLELKVRTEEAYEWGLCGMDRVEQEGSERCWRTKASFLLWAKAQPSPPLHPLPVLPYLGFPGYLFPLRKCSS